MRIAFFTLGCKVNQYETQMLSEWFEAAGFAVVPCLEEADVYVVNSCTVTSESDKKTRQMIRRFKRQNPTAIVVLTGCLPQAYPDINIPQADIVTGTGNKSQLLGMVEEALKTGGQKKSIIPYTAASTFETMQVSGFDKRTRAYIKIQDGCARYCSYCIIPTARGPVRSKSIEALRDEVNMLGENGYTEVVLVGVNLSCYGQDFGKRLIDAVITACQAKGIERVRLGSLEPELISDSDIEIMTSLEKFCPQFHLSLQSGSDNTLKRMNRHYTTAQYKEIVLNIREKFENPSITTDVMVGFPGETEEEFMESMEFVKEVKFAKAHIFAYSRRAGTLADTFSNQIPKQEKEIRAKRMSKAAGVVRERFLLSQVGTVQEVLFETDKIDYGFIGYSKNYTPVCAGDDSISGKIFKTKITAVQGDYCIGEII